MPVMDGIEATRRISEMFRDRNQVRPIILALTANAMKSDIDNNLSAGMDYHLSKPISVGVIKSTLEQLGLRL